MEQLRTVRPTGHKRELDAAGRDVECASHDHPLSGYVFPLSGYGGERVVGETRIGVIEGVVSHLHRHLG